MNMDDAFWRLCPNGILTWVKGGNQKGAITGLASVTAVGMKLTVYFLGDDKTRRVEISQLGDVANHITD
jgi:hypothetical protein